MLEFLIYFGVALLQILTFDLQPPAALGDAHSWKVELEPAMLGSSKSTALCESEKAGQAR